MGIISYVLNSHTLWHHKHSASFIIPIQFYPDRLCILPSRKYIWSISNKERNRIAYMTHGNSPSTNPIKKKRKEEKKLPCDICGKKFTSAGLVHHKHQRTVYIITYSFYIFL